MTQGSQTSRQRGGARVLLPALFMNVWLWLWLACGGECVSVNECRCAAVNERLGGAEDGGQQRGVRKRPGAVCARVSTRA